ncbi:MAG: MurR/RpiR family transcriptional regulator [Carnobacterium sp.]|uniref:MurR/RpiR family transcriptional regulator n=1 Tax=Carnobacterium antarcticum TaxID=2126436 RepID=A0ABW4NLI3_9LACT|nr:MULTISPECIES: MurR/RpiR family transcriptional regulator [unclassified Carnobacterium]ALV21779.1 Transcriptional regulator, RpiR [Carnobacterium sp. CP1]QQP69777.1 MurR/RpiR family transcriptional regulator [Carnobacterium sp. CS13]
MIDVSKLIQGKNLTELDIKILKYILENIDDVLQMGVREIAKENYTSPSTVIRLAQKLGYTGFIDLYYQLLPMVKKAAVDLNDYTDGLFSINQQDLLKDQTLQDVELFISNVLSLPQKHIFIYATGFSAIAGEYLYKKLLVLGRKATIATGTDSIGVFENNLQDIGALVVISKSGETQQVIEKLTIANESNIFTVSFTKETKNRVAELSDLNFKIMDNNKLDDRNMLPTVFFPRLLMLFEYLMKEYLQLLNSDKNKIEL